MCNIAGYAGAKQAAPILLDMLRRQEAFDAEMSTGIATIYDGKLHYRKVIGNVDTLIRETDAFSLPGTVGIAHSRPFGRQGTIPMHPNLMGMVLQFLY
jgi:glucosamine--fructose-6-phosphate aminotransferase (isomerizing)